MKIAVLQFDTLWHQPAANRAKVESLIENAAAGADIVVLPEMFTTGFTMTPSESFETMEGETVAWFRSAAARHNCAITGSVVIKENGSYYNRMFFATPEGGLYKYDKRHLFRVAGENKVYTMGDERVIVNYKGWRILLLVCYDIRFPVWSRNRGDYDLIICVASWPTVRSYAWKSLSAARAIENLSYFVACNRVGEDPKNSYGGHSAIYDFRGEPVAACEPYEECAAIADIGMEALKEFRAAFPAHLDADAFELL